MSYTQVEITDYNASAPTDDGASGSANQISWSGIKTKLGDPINTAFSSIDTNVTSACGSIDTAVTSANSTLSTIGTTLSSATSALYAPVGTVMLFVQTSAPTLWTKITAHNDKALRIVSGTASTGGSTAFTSVLASRTLTSAELPAHTHTFSDTGESVTFSRSTWTISVNKNSNTYDQSGGSTAYTNVSTNTGSLVLTASFSGTTSSSGSGSAMDFAIQYVDVILASKD